MKKTLLIAGAAVAAVLVYCYMNKDDMEMQGGEHAGMMDSMSNAAGNMMQGAQDAASNAMDSTQEMAENAMDNAKEMAGNAVEGAKDMANIEPAAGDSNLEQQAKDAAEKAANEAKGMMNNMNH